MTNTSANDRQVGGEHYKEGGDYQHWDIAEDYGMSYLQGYSTKYLTRLGKKDNVQQELEKVQHILDKYLEILCRTANNLLAEPPTRPNDAVPAVVCEQFFYRYNIALHEQRMAIILIWNWESITDLEQAKELIVKLSEIYQ